MPKAQTQKRLELAKASFEAALQNMGELGESPTQIEPGGARAEQSPGDGGPGGDPAAP